METEKDTSESIFKTSAFQGCFFNISQTDPNYGLLKAQNFKPINDTICKKTESVSKFVSIIPEQMCQDPFFNNQLLYSNHGLKNFMFLPTIYQNTLQVWERNHFQGRIDNGKCQDIELYKNNLDIELAKNQINKFSNYSMKFNLFAIYKSNSNYTIFEAKIILDNCPVCLNLNPEITPPEIYHFKYNDMLNPKYEIQSEINHNNIIKHNAPLEAIKIISSTFFGIFCSLYTLKQEEPMQVVVANKPLLVQLLQKINPLKILFHRNDDDLQNHIAKIVPKIVVKFFDFELNEAQLPNYVFWLKIAGQILSTMVFVDGFSKILLASDDLNNNSDNQDDEYSHNLPSGLLGEESPPMFDSFL